jgi:hypothetical protein
LAATAADEGDDAVIQDTKEHVRKIDCNWNYWLLQHCNINYVFDMS